MRLTLHAKIELAIVAALLLGSCEAEWEDRLDVADVNARNALAQAADLESRVSDIEDRLNM
ncbi:hypothetical protein [Sphingorhabdus contaminans]|uniref:Uncharacterized protein n=1 Tax=Sphingorhabdus contaminans TaxID=1343899 RepID=A0A553WGZ2_9SPHN|nr:hypothetical protein [Sphingorhabdus contaminans]TSB03960.1 hypothetical protein FOM92_00495 [Sphingorhabdus contaminans]